MNDRQKIRVMIVDDHDMVRRGLTAFLRTQEDVELVAEAADGQEALRLCDQTQPDVVLMDLVMPRMDGAAATRALRERWPHIQVIALTSFMDKELVQEALEAGAIGYLLKTVSTEELAEAIRAAYGGRSTVASEAVQILALAEQLEQLEQDIAALQPNETELPNVLGRHLPSMLPSCHLEIHRFATGTLLRLPDDAPPVPMTTWQWARTLTRPRSFAPGSALPWGGQVNAGETLILAPIVEADDPSPTGAIHVACNQEIDPSTYLLPAVQGVAVQVALAHRNAVNRAQSQAHERVVQELALAGRIQASFLPEAVPEMKGWQIAAALLPARETSGDFYDFLPLPDGRLGFLVADVTDKGMGAALYMALSRTLIRTYAEEFGDRLDHVFQAVSQRILSDSRADLFVSVFYGILDPRTGQLTYCNAGHHPPYLLRAGSPEGGLELRRTAMF